jgi:hypothetical protein
LLCKACIDRGLAYSAKRVILKKYAICAKSTFDKRPSIFIGSKLILSE